MANLRQFRSYNEHDVINLYAFSGTLPVNKGTLVKVQGNGWKSDDELSLLGDVGGDYANVVSDRYGVAAKVSIAASGEAPLGILLYDVQETDENGEKLIFNPRKAAEMNVALSGQAVPVLTKGIVLYSGVGGTPVAGATAYGTTDGVITAVTTTQAVGKFLGVKDANNNVLVKLNL